MKTEKCSWLLSESSNPAHITSSGGSAELRPGAPGEPGRRTVDQRYLVLVVDDDIGVRDYIKKILEREGLQILEASDGVDGLALLHRLGGAVDLLISDLRMPRMTGIELAESIRTECPTIPVIFVSGELPIEALHDPARGFYVLGRPFHAKDLLFAAQRMLLSKSWVQECSVKKQSTG